MENITKGLIGLSMFAFVLAIVGALFGFQLAGVASEGFSLASTNLALIAIGLSLCFKKS